jgi:hypothetical protein
MNDFERIAKQRREVGAYRELVQFLRDNKQWWLVPLLLVLVGMGAILLLSSSAAAPFIYTLF